MVIGSFDGADIIAMPDSPGFREIELTMNDTASVSRSPWNNTQQVQWYPADGWTGTVTLPSMKNDDIAAWEAFLAECRGMKNVFYLGHPLKASPRGFALGVPKVDSSNDAYNLAGDTNLHLKGWQTPTHLRQLLPGDHIQVGYYLHQVVVPMDTDDNGDSYATVWPVLREDVADNTPLILDNPRGLFRLAENKRSITTSYTRVGNFSFKVMEARKNAA